MIPRFVDWIWHVRGSLGLAPEQSNDEAFDKLDFLFRQYGTSHERTDDTLTFHKKDQAAQDKMSVFDHGTLRIEPGVAGVVLRYHLVSRALLFCFLAPVLFLGIAQLTVVIGKLERSPTAAAGKPGKASGATQKHAAKDPVVPMNPIDKALGAPAPDDKKGVDKEKKDEKPSPTAAYVFAAIFATLYVAGRILEDRLVKALFRKSLLSP